MTRVWTKTFLGASLGLAALNWASSGLGQLPAIPAIPAVPAVPAVDPAPALEPVRDAAKDAADAAKDTAKDATQPLPGAVRDATREARDTVRDARDTARDAVRDVRDTVREVRGPLNALANARANLRWQDMRSADVGLWFNGKADSGLVIADVGTQGPIAKLGFQEGDRIVSVGGQTVSTQANFMQHLFSSKAADGRVAVIVDRGGKQETLYMEPKMFLTHANTPQNDSLEHIGIVADDRVEGKAVVWRVTPRSAAFYAGLRNGDVITKFNSQAVTTSAELSELAAKAQAGSIALEVQRGDKTRQLEVDFQDQRTPIRSALRPNFDNDDAPALNASIRTPEVRGYYNSGSNAGRRGLFRWRR